MMNRHVLTHTHTSLGKQWKDLPQYIFAFEAENEVPSFSLTFSSSFPSVLISSLFTPLSRAPSFPPSLPPLFSLIIFPGDDREGLRLHRCPSILAMRSCTNNQKCSWYDPSRYSPLASFYLFFFVSYSSFLSFSFFFFFF